METNNKKIIDLVNDSLKGELNEESFTEIEFKTIQANQLSGLVFKSLNKNVISLEVYKKFQTDYYLYIRVDEIQSQLIEQLRMLFNQEKIPFIFLKGSFIKNLYPHKFMRSMGDIDVLVRREDMKRIHEVLENKGY
ncbi:MAG: nucleotidyltransferase family protein, partial [Candidatus Izemoplasmatales bacterium]